jgi:hypothetical protein
MRRKESPEREPATLRNVINRVPKENDLRGAVEGAHSLRGDCGQRHYSDKQAKNLPFQALLKIVKSLRLVENLFCRGAEGLAARRRVWY